MARESVTQYCFQCNQERMCLKTGFRFRLGYMHEEECYNADLFMCGRCGSMSVNGACLDSVSGREVHWVDGEWSAGLLRLVRRWMPEYERFFKHKGTLMDVVKEEEERGGD